MTRQMLIPDATHPITIEPTLGRVVVRVGEQVVADTRSALTLQEASYPAVQYVPIDDVDPAVLRRTDSHTYCPYKGEASYYTLVTAGAQITDAVWTYETPYDSVVEIAGHVAFYPQHVAVSVGERELT
jgi:uncharacterized protein (DUF427 family)